MTEVADMLEVLHRLCQQRGWALLLTSQHGTARFSGPRASVLRTLAVVNPEASGPSRRRRIFDGELIASAPLVDSVQVSYAAAAIVADLVKHGYINAETT